MSCICISFLKGKMEMKIKSVVKKVYGWLQTKKFGVVAGNDVYIGKNCSLKGRKHIILEDLVMIRPYTQIWTESGNVRIGKGSEIGERCRISIVNFLEIGEKVLLSPNIYITDCDHEYRNIDIAVIDQGIAQNGQKVSIGEGSYIGINTVIVGNVKIGKHCVIGANSVVTHNIPNYSVAVGSPAKVIKKMTISS